jgi:APA family basic amino acid/polyamine antiporter
VLLLKVATTLSGQREAACGLVRGISRGHLLALQVNSIIGAGILGLPSTAFALSGEYSLVAWVVCAGLAAGIALCVAEVSSRYDQSGGPYLFTFDAFGPSVGFVIGWLMWISRALAFAAVCGLLVEYAGFFVEPATRGAGRVALVSLVVGGITALLLAGIRQTAWVSTALTVAKVALLGAFALVGILFAGMPLDVGPAPSFTSFATTVSVVLFAFFGLENGPIASGETASPQRNLPFAILTSIAIVTALYLMVQYACIVTLPGLSQSRRPIADSATLILGSSGGQIVGAGAIVVMLGTLLTQMVGTTRILMAMGQQGQLPSGIASLHPVRRVPVLATLMSAGIALAATLLSTFTSAIAITVATRVFVYAAVCLALPVLRARQQAPPVFRLRAGNMIALLSATLCLSLIGTSTVRDILATVTVSAVGWIVWRCVRERWPVRIEHQSAGH